MPHPITRPCGTYAAARRHERRHEPLCAPCIDARREWYRDRARIAYSLPAFRARENARTAARMAHRRATDPGWRLRANEARRARRAVEREAARNAADPVAVDRYVAGDTTIRLNRAERVEAYRVFRARGVSHNQAAIRLGVSGTTARKLVEETSTSLLKVVGGHRDNSSRAGQRANATRPLTESPECPGGRLMPSISACRPDSFSVVAG